MRNRLSIVIPALFLLSTSAWAQSGLPSASLPDRTTANPAPNVEMLKSASLPDRTQTQVIPPPRPDQFLATPDTYSPDPSRRRHRPPFGVPIGLGYGYPYFIGAPEVPEVHREPPKGYLHLDLQPGNAQVFVDGYYMGAVDDFRRLIPGRPLEPGPHRIEVRAPGYEPRTFDVMIPPSETVSYRTDLRREGEGATRVSATPGRPKTFYVIPGCYAGDRPPRGKLPAGCDRAKVRTVPPSKGPVS